MVLLWGVAYFFFFYKKKSVLTTLAAITMWEDYHRRSPFAYMLPPISDLFWRPWAFVARCVEVLRLDTAHTTALTQERRRRRVDDVAKRAEFRKAHGLDQNTGFGGWTLRNDDADAALREAQAAAGTEAGTEAVTEAGAGRTGTGGAAETGTQGAGSTGALGAEKEAAGADGSNRAGLDPSDALNNAKASAAAKADGGGGAVRTVRQRVFIDSEGNKRPLKMWFGLW